MAKTLLSSLKYLYSEKVRLFLRHSSRLLNGFDIMELFGRVYLKVQQGDITVNGFKATAIYHVNRNVFGSEDSITSTVTVPRLIKKLLNLDMSPFQVYQPSMTHLNRVHLNLLK